jgi:hypothetical protein
MTFCIEVLITIFFLLGSGCIVGGEPSGKREVSISDIQSIYLTPPRVCRVWERAALNDEGQIYVK